MVNRLGAPLTVWTVSDRPTVCVCTGDPLSLTTIEKLNVPAAVGDPEITPLLDICNPAGKPPEAIVHV